MSTFRPWYDDPQRRSDVVTIPLYWVALVLSLLLHVAALWFFAIHRPMLMPGMEPNDITVPMSVELATAPPSRQPAAPAAIPSPPPSVAMLPPPSPPRPKRSPPRPRVPPILAAIPGVPSTERLPMLPGPVAPPAIEPRQVTPPPAEEMAGDLSSYIASQRQARGEAPPPPSANPADDREARRDRAIAANLASSNSPTYYGEPKNSGGVFRITFIGYDYAEFTFFGWNKEIRRRASQKIDVARGDNANIRIAIVRKMISIIREYEQEDFAWKSERLGRTITLSARPKDTATLEDFMMRDFFDTPQPVR